MIHRSESLPEATPPINPGLDVLAPSLCLPHSPHHSSMTHPYASREYAAAFEALARPIHVEALGSGFLLREVPGSGQIDAIGVHPVCVLTLGDARMGLEVLREAGAVSVVFVTDVLSQPPETVLRSAFPRVRSFKRHHLVDLGADDEPDYGKHHRYEVRRARRARRSRPVELAAALPEWWALYAELGARQEIRGLQNLPRSYFERLARLPGLVALGAFEANAMVGAHLFVEYEGRVHSHLAASSPRGYATGAAYALNDHAIRHFGRGGAQVLDLGGTAGVRDGDDGLDFFKRGFATRNETCFLCAAVLDESAYEALCEKRGRSDDFFPAYRSPAD